jgi:hypothetical protein
MDDASTFLFDVDYTEWTLKVHFPLSKDAMKKALTAAPTFSMCVVLKNGERSCIKFNNKTP